MAGNMGPSDEVGAGGVRPEESREFQSLVEELNAHPQLRALGLASDPEVVIRSVLCSLWRHMPLRQFDTLRGLLPPGIDMLVASCSRPHGSHPPPDTFRRDAFLDDLSEHLGISRERALSTATVVLPLLRERIPDDELKDVVLFLPSDLKELLLRPV